MLELSIKARRRVLKLIAEKTIRAENGCLEWRGIKNNKGYGLISIMVTPGREGKRTTIPAHRAHYMALLGRALKENAVIRHKCDNPSCVDRSHLVAGTHKDNVQDCIKRGRRAKKYKYHLRHRIHSDRTIKAIRLSIGPLKDVADKYGVSVSYVSKIRNCKAKILDIEDIISRGYQDFS